MTKKTVSILLFIAVLQLSVSANGFIQKLAENVFEAKATEQIVFLNDGETYAQISENNQSILRINIKTGTTKDTLLSLHWLKDKIEKIDAFEMDSLCERILFRSNSEKTKYNRIIANYYVYRIDRKELINVSENGKQQNAIFSPNGRMIAFARDNNLFLKKLDFNTEIAITTDGEKGKVSNGTPGESFGEAFNAFSHFEFSPDSKSLAYVRFDESEVKDLSFQYFQGTDYPTFETQKYSRAGEANAKVSVLVYDVFYKSTKTMNIGETSNCYIPMIRWNTQPDILFVAKLNRNQNQLDLYACNHRSTVGKILLTEQSKFSIDYKNLKAFTPLSNGQFIWMSEKNGYRHLFIHKTNNGAEELQLTKGEWNVTDFYGFNEKKKIAYFQSTEQSSAERAVFSIDLRGKKTCLSKQKGTNNAQFSNDFSYFINDFSSVSQPNIYSICNATNGSQTRTLENNSTLKNEISQQDFSQKEFLSFKNTENQILNGWIIKPKPFDETKKYPVILVANTNLATQSALNKWHIGWESYLATKGFIVVGIDIRGTENQGNNFSSQVYQNLGEKEAEELIDVAKQLSDFHFIDTQKIGICGWNYGGFVTLFCMTKGVEIFKAGIAVSPVTDWKFSPSFSTERFMRRPQENFKGYRESSILTKTKNLKGELLLIHGTADNEAHIQNTFAFAEELQNNGILFEMMIYPNKNLSNLEKNSSIHLFTKIADFLEKKLK